MRDGSPGTGPRRTTTDNGAATGRLRFAAALDRWKADGHVWDLRDNTERTRITAAAGTGAGPGGSLNQAGPAQLR